MLLAAVLHVTGVLEVSMHEMRQYARSSIVCLPAHSHRGYTCMCKIKIYSKYACTWSLA